MEADSLEEIIGKVGRKKAELWKRTGAVGCRSVVVTLLWKVWWRNDSFLLLCDMILVDDELID